MPCSCTVRTGPSLLCFVLYLVHTNTHKFSTTRYRSAQSPANRWARCWMGRRVEMQRAVIMRANIADYLTGIQRRYVSACEYETLDNSCNI